MKKLLMVVLLGLMIFGGKNVFAQQDSIPQDSATIAEEPKDTISIDTMDPSVYYSDEETKESSNTMTYAIIGGIVVVGGAAFFFMKKKKK
jgi:LPXTG-motif cell wall-anchored protein